MKRLTVVRPEVARHKVRDINSAKRRGPATPDPKVVDLLAYSGRNVFRIHEDPVPAA